MKELLLVIIPLLLTGAVTLAYKAPSVYNNLVMKPLSYGAILTAAILLFTIFIEHPNTLEGMLLLIESDKSLTPEQIKTMETSLKEALYESKIRLLLNTAFLVATMLIGTAIGFICDQVKMEAETQ